MKIRYNDPYGSPFELIIPDGEPEALKEIIEYLNEDARLIRNAERREAYHTLYHLEALDYTDITELTAEIIRSFVEKIEVKKPEKVPGTRAKKQTLVIWWNFIGVVDIPQQEQKGPA